MFLKVFFTYYFYVTDCTCVRMFLLFMGEPNVVIHFYKFNFFFFPLTSAMTCFFLCMEYSESVLLICTMVVCDMIFSYSCVLLVLYKYWNSENIIWALLCFFWYMCHTQSFSCNSVVAYSLKSCPPPALC